MLSNRDDIELDGDDIEKAYPRAAGFTTIERVIVLAEEPPDMLVGHDAIYSNRDNTYTLNIKSVDGREMVCDVFDKTERSVRRL